MGSSLSAAVAAYVTNVMGPVLICKFPAFRFPLPQVCFYQDPYLWNIGKDNLFVTFGCSIVEFWPRTGFSVMGTAHLHMNAFLKSFNQIYWGILLIWFEGYLIEMDSSENNSVTICFRSNHRLTRLIAFQINMNYLFSLDFREELRQEWSAKQEKIKNEEIEITYSYWDGSGHRRQVRMRKGNSIQQFLQRCLEHIRKVINQSINQSINVYLKKMYIHVHTLQLSF